MFFKGNSQNGFSLLEVIITLLFAAVLGGALVQFLGANLSDSAKAVAAVQTESQLKTTMEEITGDYREWLAQHPGVSLTAFQPLAAA